MKALIEVFRCEVGRIFRLGPAFSVLVAAAALYAVFYPQPYLNEALRKVPIAVVDQDGTVSSRELARRVGATSDVSIALVLPDLASAEREVHARIINGIFLIPKDFERDLLHGRASPVALYADASYFLMYQRIAGAVVAATQTFGAEVETRRLVAVGIEPPLAAAASDPMPLTAVALFNPQGGYATYLLPAAFVLILQQIMLVGIGVLGARPAGGGEAQGPPPAGPVTTVVGKLLAYLALEAVVVPIYLIVLPYLYGLPRLGAFSGVMLLAVPFVLSVSGLGLAVAAVFRSPQGVQLAYAALGLPFFFLAGFAWPSEAIPQGVRLVSMLLPSSSAIDGFVKVSQLGAPLSDARQELLILWGLAAFYGAVAVILEARWSRPAIQAAAGQDSRSSRCVSW